MAQHAEIVEIAAPAEAVAGHTVDIQVKIKNTHSATIGIMAGGALDYGETPWPSIEFPEYSANVGPGETRAFAGHFTMPDEDVRIHAYSYYYGSDGYWHADDEKTRDINLAELVSEFSRFTIADYSVV